MRYFGIILIIYSVIVFFSPLQHECMAAECGTGKRPLFFAVDPKLVEYMPNGFSAHFFEMLDVPLQEIGYCLTRYSSAIYNDSIYQDEMVMMLSIKFSTTSGSEQNDIESFPDNQPEASFTSADTNARITISLVEVNEWKSVERAYSLANPLLSLTYEPEERTTFESVLIKKTVENLRMHYLCHLRIESIPEGVHIRSVHGLEGVTPLEWITPLGKLPVLGDLKGYEPIRRKITLRTPGNYTYVIQMQRLHLYHSRFFVPTVALGSGSAVAFLLSQASYTSYMHLGKNDQNPNKFNTAWNITRFFEITTFTCLAAAGCTFTLCFFF